MKYFEYSLRAGTGHTASSMPGKNYCKVRIGHEFVLTLKKCQNKRKTKN